MLGELRETDCHT